MGSDLLPWIVREVLAGLVEVGPDGHLLLAGTTERLSQVMAGAGGTGQVGDVLRALGAGLDHPMPKAGLPRCVHGAYPRLCAFAGCSHFVPDGPREERWAFGPNVTEDDFACALHENAIAHARCPGSASPIHLVVERVARARLQHPVFEGSDDPESGC